MTHKSDITIVGGGIVGMTIALTLAKHTTLSIRIIEANAETPAWQHSHYHHRVSAISLSSQRILQSLNVWPFIQKARVSPFHKIEVWSHELNNHVEFDSRDLAEKQLGFILENELIHTALKEKIKEYQQIKMHEGVKLVQFVEDENDAHVTSANGDVYQAKLFVAADGANSWLRAQKDFVMQQKNYEQQAIVATVTTELPHQAVARQVFLREGPLAFLPLAEKNLSSIVWTLPTTKAIHMQSLNDEDFKLELARAFDFRLGEILHADKRFTFPLRQVNTSAYVKGRVVLAGDAAHIVHPLAGQGLNLGLLDAAALSEVVIEAYQKRRALTSSAVLRRYERWRKAENLPMLSGVDLIKYLFATDKSFLRQVVGIGLNLTNQSKSLKALFTSRAVGMGAGLPRLAGKQ